ELPEQRPGQAPGTGDQAVPHEYRVSFRRFFVSSPLVSPTPNAVKGRARRKRRISPLRGVDSDAGDFTFGPPVRGPGVVPSPSNQNVWTREDRRRAVCGQEVESDGDAHSPAERSGDRPANRGAARAA